ncbi:MAG: hypothetical protein NW207_12970 [Cytophagales bacterium]|nr:hypothetical protein [Cytophagales bacterium]
MTACRKDPGFPVSPTISFKKIEVAGSGTSQNLRLILYFTDGDGDIGLNQQDYTDNVIFMPKYERVENPKSGCEDTVQTNPNFNNIEIDFFYKLKDTTFYPLGDTLDALTCENVLASYNGRFPRLNTDNVAQPLSGDLSYDIVGIYTFLKKTFKKITIKLKVKIKDRNLNVSNTVTTDTLLIL